MAMNSKIVESILDNVYFFLNEDDPTSVFVEWEYDGHRHVTPTADRLFHAYLSETYRNMEGAEGHLNAKAALKPYVDQTLLGGKQEKLYLRTAGNLERMEYFLADRDYQKVVIQPGKWSVQKSGNYYFLKPPTLKEQALPSREGNLDLLDSYINLPEPDRLLFKIHLVQMFIDSSTHMAMILNSNKGTGKSTLSRIIRELVDPSTAPICSTPKGQRDLENLLSNAKLCVLDNTKVFGEDASNLLAGAVTGTTLSSRKLYSNLEQVTVSLKTALVLNGIDIISPKSDLCQRSLCYRLDKIPAEKRKTELEFWNAFERDKSAILGGIFDTLATALELRKELCLQRLHRMADAFQDMAAISLALGMKLDDFDKIFYQNVDKLERQFAEAHPVVEAINALMVATGKSEIRGSAQEVYKDLKRSDFGNAESFPKSPSAFSRFMNGEEEMLKAARLSFDSQKKHDFTEITIRRR